MKKSFVWHFFLIIASLLVSSCTSVSRSYENSSNPLIVETMPDKTLFALNDAFSSDGLNVIDIYGQSVDEYTLSFKEGEILSSEGIFNVNISKENYKSTFYSIEVKKMSTLIISQLPFKTIYKVGDYFTIEGLIVIDENGDKVENFNVSYRVGNTLNTSGEHIIEISKPNYISAYFTIEVDADRMLVISSYPNKTTYVVGDAFSSAGLKVGDNKGKNNLDYTLSISDGSILKYSGSIPVEVSVTGYDPISFNITVNKSTDIEVSGTKEINIFYLNDSHGSFARNASEYEAGMAYISSYLSENKTSNSLILSGGDMLQGGFESNETKGRIVVDAMNHMNFDAMVLGNHELDWGEEVIEETLNYANFPILSCNTFYSNGIDRPSWVEPYTIIQKDDLSIGIVGFARQNMGSSVSGSIAELFYFPNPISYVKEYAQKLRLSYNCDIVLAVGHDAGFDSTTDSNAKKFQELTNIDSKTGNRYVDGLFFAHDHKTKSGKLNNVPYLEAGCNCKYIGIMSFTVNKIGNIYEIADASTTTINAYNNCKTEDKTISNLVSVYSYMMPDPNEVLTTLPYSYSRDEFVTLTARAMLWFINSNPSLFNGTYTYAASYNSGGIRVYDIPRGDFTYNDLVKACPFDNALTIQTLTNKDLSYYLNDDYYCCYTLPNIVYQNGETKVATASFVAESSYVKSHQRSYIEYPNYSVKLALKEFLKSGEYRY